MILSQAEVEVIRGPEGSRDRANDQGSPKLERESYRRLVSEVRQVFADNAPAAMSALIAAGPDTPAARLLSGSGREALSMARELGDRFWHHVPAWALDSSNWFLVNAPDGPYAVQPRIASGFPCIVFDNGPFECAATGDPDVDLANVEDILQATSIYQIWGRGNLGQDGTAYVLDTGVNARLAATSGISATAVASLSTVDRDGHGSAVVEMIRALSPKSRIYSICVTESYSGGQIWNLISGLTSLYSQSGSVVNLSLGLKPEWVSQLGPQTAGFRETITNVLRSLAAQGNFAISAAGNDGLQALRWPAASTETLAVGSHNATFERSSFSNHRRDAPNMVLAPGGDVRQIDGKVSGFGRYGHGLTRDVYGTSFSTAVASALACLLSSYPWFREMQVPSRISLFKNHCRRNTEGIPILNVADIGAVWPI
jgi:subtilisin family serine protease